MINNNRSVLDVCADLSRRQGFLRHQEVMGKLRFDPEQCEEMKAYILGSECTEDLERLKQGDYFFPAPFHYRVPKNASGKMRDVYSFKGRDMYILRLIAWVLHDYDDEMLPPGLYSFRRSVQARDFLAKVRNFKDFDKYYIVKADVSNYVGSIVPEKIIPQLEEMWGHDPAFLNLLKFLLLRRECVEKDGSVVPHEPGGLGGVPVANYFMNVYLTEMDRYFYPKAPLYCRYSDDIVILANTLEEAEACRTHFMDILEERQLHTNPNKTRLIMPGEPVEILGFKAAGGKVDISDHAMEKIKRKLRIRAGRLLRRKKKYGWSDEEAGHRMIDFCNYLFYGDAGKHKLSWARWYFPVLSTANGLREVDYYARDAVRYVMCGSMHKRRLNIRTEKLHEMGYHSLVHAWYHFDWNLDGTGKSFIPPERYRKIKEKQE